MPLGMGQGQNVGLTDFCHILTLLPPNTCLVYVNFCHFMRSIKVGDLMPHDIHVYKSAMLCICISHKMTKVYFQTVGATVTVFCILHFNS